MESMTTMSRTRRRASADSPVVITDDGAGTKTYEIDPVTAEQLLTIPTVVVEKKAASKLGQGSNFRVPPKGESPSEIAARKKRNTTRVLLPGGPAETAPTASEVAQRKLRNTTRVTLSADGMPQETAATDSELAQRYKYPGLSRFALPVNERFQEPLPHHVAKIAPAAQALKRKR